MFKTRIVSHPVLSTGESNFVLHEKFSEIWSSAICHDSTVSIAVTQCSMVLVLLFHGGRWYSQMITIPTPCLVQMGFVLSPLCPLVCVWDKLLDWKDCDRKRKTLLVQRLIKVHMYVFGMLYLLWPVSVEKNIRITRMHSSRMHTTRSSGHLGGGVSSGHCYGLLPPPEGHTRRPPSSRRPPNQKARTEDHNRRPHPPDQAPPWEQAPPPTSRPPPGYLLQGILGYHLQCMLG